MIFSQCICVPVPMSKCCFIACGWLDARLPAFDGRVPFVDCQPRRADTHTSIIIINSLKLKGKYVVSPNFVPHSSSFRVRLPLAAFEFLCSWLRHEVCSIFNACPPLKDNCRRRSVACDTAAIKTGAVRRAATTTRTAIKATLSALTTLPASRHWLCTSVCPPLLQQIVGHSSFHCSCLLLRNVGRRAEQLGICWR